MYNTQPLHHTHDLRLPDWGPYTKKYNGISHIPNPKRGLRFDLSVFPGFYRRQVLVPNVKWESGYHPWEAAPDLSYYSHRYELEWKDQVYCDVSYSALTGKARLIRCEFVNNTPQDQNLVLHYMAYLNFPPVRTYSDEIIRPSQVILPEGSVWVDAVDYRDVQFAAIRPTDNLVPDGWWRAEIRDHGLVHGNGIGAGLGRDVGDMVLYQFKLEQALDDAVLLIRYRAPSRAASIIVEGLVNSVVELSASRELALQRVEVGRLAAGVHILRFTSQGGGAVDLDGFAFVDSSQADQMRFQPVEWQHVPEIISGPRANSLMLKYRDLDLYYGLAWTGEHSQVREFYTDELDRCMRYYVHEHVQKVLRGQGQGHFTNVFVRPIPVAPQSSQVLHGLVCTGSQADVEQTLAQFEPDAQQHEFEYRLARDRSAQPATTPSGQPYAFSQARMAATVLTNVVYPVYTRRSFIRHNTPGKWWDCLYTWDSGFIGLGLLELDLERAVDCLNAYTTPVGDPYAAFIHHGSPVPVQIILFLELWNRTQSRALLEYFYPRLRQYYLFLAGRLGSSTTRRLKSNLLKTWDYFYNSGGWDDYPPQVHVHQQKLEAFVAPVITTAHAIRSAKILQMAARALGLVDDVADYDADTAAWTDALNRFAWDEDAGYFGYVVHDESGLPTGILRHSSGKNFNMGIDGTSPLIAGACNLGQERVILAHLTSEQNLWTRIGLSTVDQSAPYYKPDGYWNGAVWMPHQWFYWKTCLDLCYGDVASRIARTALDLWKSEVDASYNCFEHFIVQSGRGAGWHQFGGLSTPVLSWFGAYHRPGRLTCGLDVWISHQEFAGDQCTLKATLQCHAAIARPFVVVASMNPDRVYHVTWNRQAVAFKVLFPGVLQIVLEGHGEGQLEISSVTEEMTV